LAYPPPAQDGGQCPPYGSRRPRYVLDEALDGDYFNVIQFNSSTEKLFPESVPANPDELSQARSYVERLDAGGGTEMLGALQLWAPPRHRSA